MSSSHQQWDSILRAVEALEPYAVALCAELVRTNTVNPYAGGLTGNEADGQRILARELQALDFTVTTCDPPPGLYEKVGVLGPRNRSHAGRPNLVGRWSAPRPGRTIVLNGHMDTVGIQEMTIEPFGALLKEGRLWGRGACDCKGALTAGVTAIKALRAAGALPRGTLIFESVVDEECSGGGAGTIACCLAGHRGDACILLDGFVTHLGCECMGVATGTISLTGQGGHAKQRDAVSALDLACLVKEALDGVKTEHLRSDDRAYFNIGDFHAGDAPWNVPRLARMSFNVSYSVELARQSERACGRFDGTPIRERVEAALRAVAELHPWLKAHPPVLEWIKDLPPYRTERDTAVVQAMTAAYERVTGKPAPLEVEGGWSDGAWLSRLGGMPTVSFGPARPSAPHSGDEWVAVSDLMLQAKVVALALAEMM